MTNDIQFSSFCGIDIAKSVMHTKFPPTALFLIKLLNELIF